MSGGSNLPLAGTPEQQLADPLHLFPNADNARQPSTAAPGMLPNLGAASMMPMAPKGAFNTSIQAQGLGPFNQMAAQGAGKLFNPSAQPQQTMGGGSKGLAPMPNTAIRPQIGPGMAGTFRGNVK